ncbi:hypothetical protein CCP3SC5AM1_1680001 [Gammaproteobacteria bacterium]
MIANDLNAYTIDSLLDRHAAQHPQQIAFDDGLHAIDYAEFNRLVGSLATGLNQAGVVAGDALALVLPDRLEFVVAFYAAARIGALTLPLDPTLNHIELQWYLADVAPKVVITDAHALGACRQAITQTNPQPRIIVCDVPGPDGLNALFCEPPLPPTRPVLERPLVCFHTSGSTGRPKRVVLSHGNLAAEVSQFVTAATLDATDTILCLAPLNHSYALENAMLAALGTGCTLGILPPDATPLIARLIDVVS